MSDPALLDHCRRNNPFGQQWISNPYDRREVPDAPELLAPAVAEMERLFELHRESGLSMPVVPLVADTGYGKTHLLRHLARAGHESRTRFVVNVQPEEFLDTGPATEEGALFLCEIVDRILFGEEAPGFGDLRPIDVYGHAVLRELSTHPSEQTFQIQRLIFKPLPLPEELRALMNEAAPTRRLDRFECKLRDRGVLALAASTRRLLAPCGDLQARLLMAAFGDDFPSILLGDYDPIENLLRFSELAGALSMPIVFVFDQFEDLAIDLSAGSIHDALRSFVLRLNNVIAEMLGKGEARRLPLFVLATNQELDPTSRLEAHFKERFAFLGPNRKTVDLVDFGLRVRDFATARTLTQVFMERFWAAAPGRPAAGILWPMSEEALRRLHASSTVESPRDWILRLADAWPGFVEVPGEGRPATIEPGPGPEPVPEPEPEPEPEPGPAERLAALRSDAAFRSRAEKCLLEGSDAPREDQFARFLAALHDLGVLDRPPEGPNDHDGRFWISLDGQGVLVSLFSKANQGGAHNNEWKKLQAAASKIKRSRSLADMRCVLFLRTQSHDFPLTERIGQTEVVTHHLHAEDASVVYAVLVAAEAWGAEERTRHLEGLSLLDLKDAIVEMLASWSVFQKVREAF